VTKAFWAAAVMLVLGWSTAGAQSNQPGPFKVTFLGAHHIKDAYISLVEVSFAVANEDKRDVTLIEGSVLITDKSGDEIARVKWKDNKTIKAGTSVTQIGSYSTYPGDLDALADIDLGLLKFDLDVDRVTYADGEVVAY
jgi:hypothetical protein